MREHYDMHTPTRIVNLIDQNQKNCIYFIHPMGGEIGVYFPLIAKLKSHYDMYGIVSRAHVIPLTASASDLDPDGFTNISSEYVKLILPTIDKKRPFSLLGWSMGGVLAFEVARQLYNAGYVPERVVLIDSYTPDSMPLFDNMELDEFYYHMKNMLISGVKTFDPSKINWFSKNALKLLDVLNPSVELTKRMMFMMGMTTFNEDLLLIKKILLHHLDQSYLSRNGFYLRVDTN